MTPKPVNGQEFAAGPIRLSIPTTPGATASISVNIPRRGDLLDPATANRGQPNENQVKEDIKRSMRAFEDRDRDGNDG